jgi:hypothetical protein
MEDYEQASGRRFQRLQELQEHLAEFHPEESFLIKDALLLENLSQWDQNQPGPSLFTGHREVIFNFTVIEGEVSTSAEVKQWEQAHAQWYFSALDSEAERDAQQEASGSGEDGASRPNPAQPNQDQSDPANDVHMGNQRDPESLLGQPCTYRDLAEAEVLSNFFKVKKKFLFFPQQHFQKTFIFVFHFRLQIAQQFGR